jgi:hypothetical protein
MAISLDRLSKDAVRRFFPAPSETLVRAGIMSRDNVATASYNSRFRCPKTGGIGRLVESLRTGLQGCVVNAGRYLDRLAQTNGNDAIRRELSLGADVFEHS